MFADRQVTITIPTTVETYLPVDPSLALEIMVNLLENAHRASPPDAAIELAATQIGPSVRLEARSYHALRLTRTFPVTDLDWRSRAA